MPTTKTLWWTLALAVTAAFAVLGFYGREVYRSAPPIPGRVVTSAGDTLFGQADILDGQEAWQSMGGQQVGSIWGHGAYQAPDWTADWLHREATALLEIWATREHGSGFGALSEEQQAPLLARLKRELRTNTHDPASGTVTVSADRAQAMAQVGAHYDALFGGAPSAAALREAYALSHVPLPDAAKRQKMNAFFFWTSWAAATERPGTDVTYTNNWPHEPLIGNAPSSANVMWSILSVVLLLAGIGALVWYKAFRDREDEHAAAPLTDPFDGIALTPSMRAIGKYTWVIAGLFLVQVLLGGLTAHYTIEGQGFFGVDTTHLLPYAVTRTWHIQTGIFWIATAFLAAGLFLAPAVGGREPRFQRLGVNLLFGALLVVVLGSLAGEWLRVQQHLDDTTGFWFGHQGYEYVELGRFWQIALMVGLVLWLTLMIRALKPALHLRNEHRSLVWLFAAAVTAIGLFYGAGFMYGARTHLSVMEYWRWWVVHLWVEGFFEVFATAALAFVFARMGLVRPRVATAGVLFSSAIFLAAGIPGTFHHLYFSGTPVSIMAVGASFSALEVVPLVLIGLEAYRSFRMSTAAPWMSRYRWPIVFFIGVAFWNLVGAGLFGFLINPPLALYYMQGLNTTPVHGHTALFGVYGLLSLGLTLVVLRRLKPAGVWREGLLKTAFWSMNIGLALMVVLSLLPIGILQANASIEVGLWYARSAELLQMPVFDWLRWARIVGDGIFIIGVVTFAYFVAGLWTGWSYETVPAGEGEGALQPAASSQAV